MLRLRVRGLGKAIVAIVVLAVGTSALTACTDPPQPCSTAARAGLAVAVGGRANAPAPVVPDRVGTLIDKADTDGTGDPDAVTLIGQGSVVGDGVKLGAGARLEPGSSA